MEVSNVYLIYSTMSLREIRVFLELFLIESESIGPMKIEYDRDGKDTNRTLIMCSHTLYQRLVDLGFGEYNQRNDFRMVPYKIPVNFQLKNGLHSDLYLSIPKTLSREQILVQLQQFFVYCIRYGLIVEKSWRCSPPNKNDSNWILSFDMSKIPFQNIFVVKAFLDRLRSNDHNLHFRCYWLRNNGEKV